MEIDRQSERECLKVMGWRKENEGRVEREGREGGRDGGMGGGRKDKILHPTKSFYPPQHRPRYTPPLITPTDYSLYPHTLFTGGAKP